MKRIYSAIQSILILSVCFVLFISGSRGQTVPFGTNPFNSSPTLASTKTAGAWYTDRYAPTIFEQNTLSAENVLHVGIRGADAYANRPFLFHNTFSNTQGRKFDLGSGNTFHTALTADLYVGADWATKHRMATLWGSAVDSTGTSSFFNYFGFRNFSGSDPGFYVFGYHNIGAYTLLPFTITYGQWYRLKVELSDTAFVYSINGTVVLTDTTLNGTKYFSDEILQAYNFGDSTLAVANQAFEDYDVYWDNVGAIPSPAVYTNPVLVNIKTAGNFRILAGTTVTVGTGTSVLGDVGVSPGNIVTNNGSITGTIHLHDSAAIHGQTDLAAAYADAQGRTVDATIPSELGGTILGRGVYTTANGTFGITGTLTLSGVANDVFIFKMATTLTTAVSSSIKFVGGAQLSHVFWQVGSSATIDGDFKGIILASTSISQSTGSSIEGKALAVNASVTVNGLSILPVELVSLNAIMISSGVRVEWSTLTEVNNYGFTVERSRNNTAQYETIPNSFIAGAGTSLEQHFYTFNDTRLPGAGTYYYRLRQQDLEGNISFTAPIKVEVAVLGVGGEVPREFNLFQNYPNPFNPTSTIAYRLAVESGVVLTVSNVLGQKVRALVNTTEQAGDHSVQFDASGLSSGIYYYHLEATSVSNPVDHFSRVMKMLLVR